MGRAESKRVAVPRWCLQHWPFPRGRGLLMRIAGPLLRDRPLTFRLEPGVLVQGDPEEHQCRYYLAYGLSRDPSFRLARRVVNSGDTVIDVGANVGFWLMGVARRAGPEAKIHAFEALPVNVARFKRTWHLNGLSWVRCHASRGGSATGRGSFIRHPRATPVSGRSHPAGGRATRGSRSPAWTTFCREHDVPRVDMLKVDVEGGELLVFQGARSLLTSRDAPIIMFEVGRWLADAIWNDVHREQEPCWSRTVTASFRFDGIKLRRSRRQQAIPVSEDLFALRLFHLRERPLLQDLIE